jgi:hypothetical protein
VLALDAGDHGPEQERLCRDPPDHGVEVGEQQTRELEP